MNFTINSDSSSPDPLDVHASDSVSFVAGLHPPDYIYLESGDLFGVTTVPVPSTQTVRSTAPNGNYEFWDRADVVDGRIKVGGTKVGTIKVS